VSGNGTSPGKRPFATIVNYSQGNLQTDLNRTIRTKKWLNRRVAANCRVVSHIFLVLDGLK
jgi:hypothetical protein